MSRALRRWHAVAFPRLLKVTHKGSSPQSKCLRTAVGSVAMRWWHASRGGQELGGGPTAQHVCRAHVRLDTHANTQTHAHVRIHTHVAIPCVLVVPCAACRPCHRLSSWSPPVVHVTAMCAALPCCHACSPSAPRWCCVGRAAWRCLQSLMMTQIDGWTRGAVKRMAHHAVSRKWKWELADFWLLLIN